MANRGVQPTRPNLTRNHLIQLLWRSDLGPNIKNPSQWVGFGFLPPKPMKLDLLEDL